MLIPAFTFKLGSSVIHGLATVGLYDGKHPVLTCGTSAGRVLMHHPHVRNDDGSALISHLTINKRLTGLQAGRMKPGLERDVLMVGTATSLMAYDVDENSQLFQTDVESGVHSLIVGAVPGIDVPLAVVGGNCTIYGFDAEGNELFWTVTGDNVTSLAFCDADGDGENELLVGSADFEVRIFQREVVISEVTETDRVMALAPLQLTRYGYGLENGTVGVYNGSERVWRVKSKSSPMAILGFDLDADGEPELISGWASGRLGVRNQLNGEVVFKDRFGSSVSALVAADYRLDGQETVIAASVEGDVRGYLPAEPEMGTVVVGGDGSGSGGGGGGGSASTTAAAVASAVAGDASSFSEGGGGGGGGRRVRKARARGADSRALAQLQKRKQELMLEMRSISSNLSKLKEGSLGAGVIPPSTRLSSQMTVSRSHRCAELLLSTNNETVIKAIMLFSLDGGLFEGESLVVYPSPPGSSIRVPLKAPKDDAIALTAKVLVAARSSAMQYHVFDVKHMLPKFAMYADAKPGTDSPESYVTFSVPERAGRIALWVNSSFIGQEVRPSGERLDVTFVSLRTDLPLRIEFVDGVTTVYSDDMAVAADVVDHLTKFLDISELESRAHFPTEMSEFEAVLRNVDDYNTIRLQLTAEMAESSALVKALVVKAEDARRREDMVLMQEYYSRLYNKNMELLGEYTKRRTNHDQLLKALKKVNQMIQKASNLRVGKARVNLVAACRAAMRKNNIAALFQIITEGTPPAS